MELETKTDTHHQMDDLRLVRPRRCCTPCCRRACAVACAALTIAVAVLCSYAVPFAIRLEHGMEYMADMKTHTLHALSLNGRNLSWYHVDDPVMGGHSSSALEVTPTGGLRFFGNISTRDGGFASCATTEQSLGLSDATAGFRVAVEGNGELFKFTVHTSSSVWEPVWQVDLPPASLGRGVHSFVLPLASFTANRMGRSVHGATLRPSAIQSVGLNLALVDMRGDPNPHFRDGPFELTLHAVAAVESAEAAAEAVEAMQDEALGTAASAAPPSQAASTVVVTADGPPSGATVAPADEGSVLLASFGGAAEGGGASALQWLVMNDPVMGGVSHSRLTVEGGVATFSGTCAVVPFLHAPGFCRMATAGAPALPDASAFADGGALHLTLRSSTPRYAGFKVGFSSDHMRTTPGVHHGSPTFKADLTLPPPPSSSSSAAPGAATGASGSGSGSSSNDDDGFVTVRVPFAAFSLDTSEYTGRCDTTDPTGQHHHCCTAAHPEVCPAAEHLRSLHGLQLWAEGVEGDFALAVRSIAAGP